MHPFTTFLTHIAASLTGCGNCRGYASKAAKERRQRDIRNNSIDYLDRLIFFFFFFINGNWKISEMVIIWFGNDWFIIRYTMSFYLSIVRVIFLFSTNGK